MQKKISISDTLFYIPYIMWIIINILKFTFYRDIYFVQQLFKITELSIYILLAFKILYDNKYSFKTVKWGMFFLIVFIVGILSNSKSLIQIMMFIYAAKDIKFKKILKITLLVQIILASFIIGSSLTGIIKNDIWLRSNGSFRYGLGYTYCTFSANFYYHIILMYLYVKDEKGINLIETCIILIINQILYILTDTKAVYYLIWLLVIAICINKVRKRRVKFNFLTRVLYKYCFIISALIAIVFSILYDASNKFYIFLNAVFTDRLVLGNLMYKQYGIPLFGQNVLWVTGRAGIERASNTVYNFVDSSYLNIAINFGIVILILVCLGFTAIESNLIKNNRKNQCLVLAFLAIHSISDPQLLQMQYHAFLLMFGTFFSSSKLKELTGGFSMEDIK